MENTTKSGSACVKQNFEEMYFQMADENQKLRLENERLKCELGNTRNQCAILEGQINIVKLIFGGKA